MLGIWILSIQHVNRGGSKDPTISDSVIKEKARRRLEEKSSESVYTYGIINPKKGTELACVGQPHPISLFCISTSKPKLSTLTNLNEPPRGKEILASSFTSSTSSDCWRSKEVLLVDVSVFMMMCTSKTLRTTHPPCSSQNRNRNQSELANTVVVY
jgi:hypothetical protein